MGKGLGPVHPDTLIGVSNLGWVLWRQGKYEEAEGMHRRALEGRDKVLWARAPRHAHEHGQPGVDVLEPREAEELE